MARALDQIISELDAVYRPQRDLYNQQLSAADPALEAEKKGLMAQKEDSFRQITDQANRRGMFYSGLPIAEEQRYTGQQFLPAVANLQSKYATQKFGLQETLAKLAQDQSAQAYGIRDKELAREEEQRQFDARLAAQQQADAASRASAGGGYNFGSGNTQRQSVLGATQVKAADQQLFNQMFLKSDGGQWSNQDLVNDYNRTLISARNGNTRDIQKINFYHSFRPDIFGSNQPSLAAPSAGVRAAQTAVSSSLPKTTSVIPALGR